MSNLIVIAVLDWIKFEFMVHKGLGLCQGLILWQYLHFLPGYSDLAGHPLEFEFEVQSCI